MVSCPAFLQFTAVFTLDPAALRQLVQPFFGTAAVYFLILHVPAGEAGMGCQSAEPWMSLGQLMQVSQPAGKPGLPRGRRAAVPGRHLGGGTRCPWRTA